MPAHDEINQRHSPRKAATFKRRQRNPSLDPRHAPHNQIDQRRLSLSLETPHYFLKGSKRK